MGNKIIHTIQDSTNALFLFASKDINSIVSLLPTEILYHILSFTNNKRILFIKWNLNDINLFVGTTEIKKNKNILLPFQNTNIIGIGMKDRGKSKNGIFKLTIHPFMFEECPGTNLILFDFLLGERYRGTLFFLSTNNWYCHEKICVKQWEQLPKQFSKNTYLQRRLGKTIFLISFDKWELPKD